MGGFDTDLYWHRPEPTAPTEGPLEVLTKMNQYQAQRQQMQQAQYQMERQRNLQSLITQNAGAYQDPSARAYALGGYGEEAAAAQAAAIQRQQHQLAIQESAAKLDNIHRDLTASRLATAKTQEDYDAIAGNLPAEYGLKAGVPDWQEAVKTFRASRITPEQEAQNAKGADKNRYEMKFNPVSGAAYREDKMTGQFIPVNGGGGGPVPDGTPRDMPAPLGSKMGTAKRELLDALGKDLDPTQGRANLPTEVQNQIRAAERLDQLAKAPGPMTAQRLHEMTMMSATIANGGHVPTESMVESMFPRTLRGKSAEFWQSVANVPMDAGAQPFVDQLLQQSERETGLGKKQIQQYLLGRLVKHPDAFRHFPVEAGRMAEGAGLKGLYDGKTLLPVKGAHPDDGKAVKWAKATLAKDPGNADALAILKANGVE